MALESLAGHNGRDVIPLPGCRADNTYLVDGLRNLEAWATEDLYDRFQDLIHARVWRTMGADPDHDEIVHQVFINIIASIKKLKEPGAIVEWIKSVTINTILLELRDRKRRRRIVTIPRYPEDINGDADGRVDVMLLRAFTVLREMAPDEHVAFVLRFVEGCSLEEVAGECGYSLATAKRKIKAARQEFTRRASRDPVLAVLIRDRQDG